MTSRCRGGPHWGLCGRPGPRAGPVGWVALTMASCCRRGPHGRLCGRPGHVGGGPVASDLRWGWKGGVRMVHVGEERGGAHCIALRGLLKVLSTLCLVASIRGSLASSCHLASSCRLGVWELGVDSSLVSSKFASLTGFCSALYREATGERHCSMESRDLIGLEGND